MNIFNAREVSYILIFVFFIVFVFCKIKKDSFELFGNLIKAIFQKKILFIFVFYLLWFYLCVKFLLGIGVISVSNIKTIVVWFVFSGLYYIFNFIGKKNLIDFHEIKAQFKLSFFISIFISQYVSGIVLEIFLSILLVIGSCIAALNNRDTKDIGEKIIAFVAMCYICIAIYYFNWNDFKFIDLLVESVLPFTLLILSLPLGIFIGYYAKWELLQLRIKYVVEGGNNFVVKNYLLLSFLFSLSELSLFLEYLTGWGKAGDIKELRYRIKMFKNRRKLEKRIFSEDGVDGSNIKKIMQIMSEEGFEFNGYKPSLDAWVATSERLISKNREIYLDNYCQGYLSGNEIDICEILLSTYINGDFCKDSYRLHKTKFENIVFKLSGRKTSENMMKKFNKKIGKIAVDNSVENFKNNIGVNIRTKIIIKK